VAAVGRRIVKPRAHVVETVRRIVDAARVLEGVGADEVACRGSCSTFASQLSPSALAEGICRHGRMEVSGMSIKTPTRAFFLVIPIVILLGTAFSLTWNLVTGVTPANQALETGLVVAILVGVTLGIGLVYILVDARLRGVGGGTANPSRRARTRVRC